MPTEDSLNDFIETELEKESCQKMPEALPSSDIEKFKVGVTETKTNSLCHKCGQLFSDQNNMTTCDSCHEIVISKREEFKTDADCACIASIPETSFNHDWKKRSSLETKQKMARLTEKHSLTNTTMYKICTLEVSISKFSLASTICIHS